MARIWLDDVRPMPIDFDIHFRRAEDLIKWIQKFPRTVYEISFDHDLGDRVPTGYDVAKVIEALAYKGFLNRVKWIVHSANPVGRQNIEAAMRSAEKFWATEKKGDRYFLMVDGGEEFEVTKEKFMEAEHRCGFRSKTPGEPATAGFTSGMMRGTVKYDF